jgi:hypothetical protein
MLRCTSLHQIAPVCSDFEAPRERRDPRSPLRRSTKPDHIRVNPTTFFSDDFVDHSVDDSEILEVAETSANNRGMTNQFACDLLALLIPLAIPPNFQTQELNQFS